MFYTSPGGKASPHNTIVKTQLSSPGRYIRVFTCALDQHSATGPLGIIAFYRPASSQPHTCPARNYHCLGYRKPISIVRNVWAWIFHWSFSDWLTDKFVFLHQMAPKSHLSLISAETCSLTPGESVMSPVNIAILERNHKLWSHWDINRAHSQHANPSFSTGYKT